MAYTDVEIAEARSAALSGQCDDLYKLGLIYSTGQGGEVDLIQAHMWFNLAAMRGSNAAKECRKELSGLMSQMEIASAQKAAREWLETLH
ncbi:MAG: sel1 repeat family protein [Caulobacterales bacterium]